MSPSSRLVRVVRWLVWPVAAVVALAVVSQGSYAAYNAKVSNSGNSIGVGSVDLTDNDSGSALVSLANLKPSSSGSRCIAVTSSGTLPASIELYVTDAATTRGLSSYVAVTITQGTGAAFGTCTGFTALSSGSAVYSGTLASLTSTATGYASGVGSWTPTGKTSETRSFQLAYVVSSAIPDSAQGGTASFGLTWEAQNS